MRISAARRSDVFGLRRILRGTYSFPNDPNGQIDRTRDIRRYKNDTGAPLMEEIESPTHRYYSIKKNVSSFNERVYRLLNKKIPALA